MFPWIDSYPEDGQANCAVLSANLCSVIQLNTLSSVTGEYIWTSVSTTGGNTILFYKYPNGAYFNVADNVTPNDPADHGNRTVCCKDPVQ